MTFVLEVKTRIIITTLKADGKEILISLDVPRFGHLFEAIEGIL